MVRATTTTQPETQPEVSVPRSESSLRWSGLVRLARPRHWTKNLLVFAAPSAAGVLTHGTAAAHAGIAFVIFCLAASGTYYLNDAFDVAADRRHSVKRFRPVVAGEVPVPLAVGGGALLVALTIGLAWWLIGELVALVIAIYVAVTTAYSVRLKHEPG